MPHPQASEAAKRAARVSAGKLLILEERTHRALKTSISDGVDEAVAQLARQRHRELTKAAAIATLLAASRGMQDRIHRALLGGRKAARDGARARLGVELKAAGVDDVDVEPTNGAEEDDYQAEHSAISLTTQWRGLAVAFALRALLKDEDPIDAVDGTRDLMRYRTGRTAATETAQAYSDEHRSALAELTEQDERFTSGLAGYQLTRVWNAVMDRRTCEECAAHDGELALPGGSFEGGDEPGNMHPLCRCIPNLIALPVSAIEAGVYARAA